MKKQSSGTVQNKAMEILNQIDSKKSPFMAVQQAPALISNSTPKDESSGALRQRFDRQEMDKNEQAVNAEDCFSDNESSH